MGQFTVKAALAHPDRPEQPIEVELLVDPGAAFTWLPREVADALGLVPHAIQIIEFADGRVAEQGLARAWITLEGQTELTLCLIGDPGTRALLGAVTLEELRLGVDPVNRRLIAIRPFVAGP